MKHYKTAEVAAMTGIHPNTVRLYEKWELIPSAARQKNGYRIFTDFHIRQIQLARIAFRIELVQNGLRGKIVEMVKASAAHDFDKAIALTHEYLAQLVRERCNAEEAVEIVQRILSKTEEDTVFAMKRKEVSEYLDISMDTLRNWEMNGLLTVRRRQNGYRIYTDSDIKKLKIIRSLRSANYSLEAILRLLQQLSENPGTDIQTALNSPAQSDTIISVCDRLISSVQAAEENAHELLDMLQEMKIRF